MKTWVDAPLPPQEIPRVSNRPHCKANVRFFFKLLLWLMNTVWSSVNCFYVTSLNYIYWEVITEQHLQ